MIRTLDVYLNQTKVGILKETNGKSYSFEYYPKSKEIISLSMKDFNVVYKDKVVRPFLENLLPEGQILTNVAKIHLVSQNNPFSILSKIGEDCAGAISFTNEPSNIKTPPKELSYENFLNILNKNESGKFFYEKGMRLSLAGAQNKLSLIIRNNKYFLPNISNPSNYIIKFNNLTFPSLLINEYFSATLAELLGIPVSKVDYKKEPYPYLLITRYDRLNNLRIHQEDFCQVLSIRPQNKYQIDGGPSFKDVSNFIKNNLKNPALEVLNLAKLLVFNFLIGNCDAHAKNISILYKEGIILAPFYDIVSTYIYEDISKNMAMSINKKYDIDSINKEDIIKEFDSWNLNGKSILNLILNEFKDIIFLTKNICIEPNEDVEKIINLIRNNLEKLTM